MLSHDNDLSHGKSVPGNIPCGLAIGNMLSYGLRVKDILHENSHMEMLSCTPTITGLAENHDLLRQDDFEVSALFERRCEL
jgi:hypothetical protein